MDKSAGTLDSKPGSMFYVPPAELSNKSIITKLKAIMDDGEVMNVISTDQATYGLQLVKELGRRSSEAEHSEEMASVNVKTLLKADDVENVESIGEKTATATQLVEELQHQEDKTGLSIASADLGDKFVVSNADTISKDDEAENITSTGQATYAIQSIKDLIPQDSETELKIPPTEVREKLMVANMETVSKDDEVENNFSTDQASNDLQLLKELHHQDNETKFHDEGIVANVKAMLNDDEVENTISTQATNGSQLATDLCQQDNETETQLQVGTFSIGKVLIDEEEKIAEELLKQMREGEDQKQEKIKLKLTLNEKRTEIAGELEALKAQTDQKLMKIDQIVNREKEINNEITHMECQCNENKCRHAKFIELFKLIVESGLPLCANREIKNFMNKEDQLAQKFLSKAMKLETQIEAQAKEKLTLQEERTEIAEQVESLKVRIDQKLKEAGEVNKLEEALDSEITCIESQYSESELRYAKKRKTHDGQLSEELSPSENGAKRMTLNTADSSQECVRDGTTASP